MFYLIRNFNKWFNWYVVNGNENEFFDKVFKKIYWAFRFIEDIVEPKTPNKFIKKRIGKKEMYINPYLGQGKEIYFDGSAEKHVIEVLEYFLKEGLTYFDIGAKWGFHTVIFSDKIGKNGIIISFEPNPFSYKILTKKIN